MAKKGSLKELVTGKLIDAQGGFVSTFNFLVRAFGINLKAEKPFKIDWVADDRPVIKLDPDASFIQAADNSIEITFDKLKGVYKIRARYI